MILGALRRRLRDGKRRRAIRSIRSTMLGFGFDLEPFSDAEIIDATENFARLTIKAGPTCRQAAEALSQFHRSVNAQTACFREIDYLGREHRK